MREAKPFEISKQMVKLAFDKVKANKGAHGVDEQSIEAFEKNLKDNLYKIWNRLSSGSYFPTSVRAVEIPKKNGGTRLLGVPTVEDRVAQMVAKLYLEPKVNHYFMRIHMATDQRNQQYKRWKLREEGAGEKIGF